MLQYISYSASYLHLPLNFKWIMSPVKLGGHLPLIIHLPLIFHLPYAHPLMEKQHLRLRHLQIIRQLLF